MLWTIRRKLSAISLLALVFLLAVGGTALVGAQNASDSANRQRALASIAGRQLDGEYNENAVRADVWEAISTTKNSDIKDIEAEFNSYASIWLGDVDAVSKSTAPVALRKQAAALEPAIVSVTAQAKAAIERAMVNTSDARGLAAIFDQTFDPLDTSMKALTRKLDTESARTKTAADQSASLERSLLIGVLIVAVVALFLLAKIISRSIVKPLDACVAGLEQLAGRDLTATFGRASKDEIGRMVSALTSAIGDIRSALGEIVERSQIVDSASHELSAVSQQLAASAEETASQARSVSSAARTVNDNVSSVATGTAQLSGSMREVADSASDAATTAREAAGLADRAELVLATLRDASLQIGNTVTVIRGVAEQTHLLALNATIEAARAGASGRGFAVVAEEVKSLARTTSESTDQVADVVEAMQDSVREVVDVIARIATTVRGIDGNQSTIAHAVEEQTLTAGTMRNGVADAAEGIRAITANIDSVAESAASTTEGVTSAQRAADELAETAAQLAALAGGFRY